MTGTDYCKTYWALSTNNDNFRVLSKRLAVEFTTLDTCTNGSCAARPITWAGVLLDKLDVLKAVGVDNEGTVAS